MSVKALVLAASRHGSTAGIAAEIQGELARHGVDAVLVPLGEAPPPDAFDVVVLGSAVYVGRWMDEAKAYASRHQQALRARRVYLFSSGPLGDPPHPPEEPADAPVMKKLTGARDHATFPGRLDKAGLNLAERAMVKLVQAPYGDYRPWERIRAWARGIAVDAEALPAGGVP